MVIDLSVGLLAHEYMVYFFHSDGSSSNAGLIAGVTVAVLILLVIAVVLAVIFIRR